MIKDFLRRGFFFLNISSALLEIFKHWFADKQHALRIRKIDKVSDKLGTMEHLIVKLEKKTKQNKDDIIAIRKELFWMKIINITLMLAILIMLLLHQGLL